jgi:hypothetical protein
VGYDGDWQAKAACVPNLIVHFVGYCACVWVASSHITTVGVLRYPIVFVFPIEYNFFHRSNLCEPRFFLGSRSHAVGINGLQCLQS